MKYKSLYIYAVALILALNVVGCDKNDSVDAAGDMIQLDGIALRLGSSEASPAVTSATRATVDGIVYAVNTNEDPTSQAYFATNRLDWFLDFDLYNGNNGSGVDETPYADASFTGGKYDNTAQSWKPAPPDDNKQLHFPNYFKPHVEAWLYPDPATKDDAVVVDQSDQNVFLAQDILYRRKAVIAGNATEPFGKKLSVQLSHQRAMLNFKFHDIVREDIDESTVVVNVGGTEYTPYSVRTSGVLEYMLILPETLPATTEIIVEYETVGNDLQQPIKYKQTVNLNKTGTLESNNCYCFTLSPKALTISPVTIVNWSTGEPVLGEYVAVTAYPTFKGLANTTYYFYYDNQLTEDGTLNGEPKKQAISFNNDGECTIKPDGRIITHIFPESLKEITPDDPQWEVYKLNPSIILGGNILGNNTEKMYIDLSSILP